MYLLGSIYPLQRVPPLPLRWSTNKLDVGFSPYIKRGCSPRSAVRAIRESNTERNIMLICGIDIGKNHHEACLIDETGRQLAKTLRFPNTTAGANTLMDYFSGCNSEHDVIVVGMEATGHYWLSLYCFLFDQGFQVNVINPVQSDAVRNLFLRKTKNDAKDSFLIAETIRIGRYSNTELADEDVLSCVSFAATEWIWSITSPTRSARSSASWIVYFQNIRRCFPTCSAVRQRNCSPVRSHPRRYSKSPRTNSA